jgi:hypothetical protein
MSPSSSYFWLAIALGCVGGCFPSFEGLSGGPPGSAEASADAVSSQDATPESGSSTLDAAVEASRDAPLDAPDMSCVIDQNADAGSGKNCGRCGRDCELGQCVDGDCTPYVFASGHQPVQLAIDNGFLYWTNSGNNGSIYRISRSAGAGGAKLLVSGQANPSGIVVTVDKMYWLDQGTADQSGKITGSDGFLMSATIDAMGASGVQMVGSSFKRPLSLAVDAGRVYVAEHGVNAPNSASDGDIMSCTTPVCADRRLHADIAVFPVQVLLRAGTLYWTSEPSGPDDSGSIWQVPLTAGSKAVPLFPGTKPQAHKMAFTGDGATLYYASKNFQSITRHPLGPGTITQLHDNFEPHAVLVDDTYLYAIVANDYNVPNQGNVGSLVRVGKDDLTENGAPPASFKKFAVPRGGDAIIDGGRSVYFTTETSIMKLVK